jgi:hypothetical protein
VNSIVTTGTSAARAALVLSVLVAVGVIAQSILAGAFYEDAHHHAVDVHKALGPALIAPAILVAIICGITLRAVPGGRRTFAAATTTAVLLAIETALGLGAEHHSALLVLHVPIALGLFAMLARQITSLATIIRAHRRFHPTKQA